jgi:hypothetical protein
MPIRIIMFYQNRKGRINSMFWRINAKTESLL